MCHFAHPLARPPHRLRPIHPGWHFMNHRCVILDDYQNVALKLADWSPVSKDLDITVHDTHLGGPERVIEALRGASIVCLMRERTPLPGAVIEALPDLR